MKSNKVILDLDVYNVLRDFRINIEKNNVVYFSHFSWDGIEKVYTLDDAYKQLAEENKMFAIKIKELKNQPLIDELKKMNWLQFRKWKKNIK